MRPRAPTLSVILALLLLSAPPPRRALAADPTYDPLWGHTIALEAALAGASVGLGVMTALEVTGNKANFQLEKPVVGWAAGGSVAAVCSGTIIALAGDRRPSWPAAALATLTSASVAVLGLWWMNRIAAEPRPTPNETAYAVVGGLVPFVTALVGSLTYQGVRALAVPAPSPTPRALPTPWPSPTPPVRIWL